MLNFRKPVALLIVLAMCMAVLAGCGAEKSLSPQNLTYDKTTGEFSFDAVEGINTYVVGVGKIINDTTGQALTSINQSSAITLNDGTEVYLWSEQTGSVSGLADSDNDGKVSGKVVFREYSSSATTVGAVITDLSKLPVGHYVLQAIPAATDEVPNPEAALLEFVITGTLETPSGFTASITQDGYMEITAPSNYYHNCMTVTGLPTKMVFEISQNGTVVETIEMDDFSYTNSVNGPNKSFSYNNNTVTGKVKLDSTKTYEVKVTAVGDGSEIKDASAKAYMATSTPTIEFATKHSHSASGTAGALSVSVSLGKDAAGNNIYELAATVNSVTVLRESGTYTATAEVGADGNYPEGAVLTFKTDKSDAATAILDGVSLTAAVETTENWGQTSTTYFFSGKAVLDGEEFEFAKASGGNNSSGGGGMGGPGGSEGGEPSQQGGAPDQGGQQNPDQGSQQQGGAPDQGGQQNPDQGGEGGSEGGEGASDPTQPAEGGSEGGEGASDPTQPAEGGSEGGEGGSEGGEGGSEGGEPPADENQQN